MSKEEIRRFFEGVIVNGITREVVFLDTSECGRLEAKLVAPPQTSVPPVYLSFPQEAST